MKEWIIIVNGLPATGKTTLANKLSEQLNLPIFRKDDIKESLGDALTTIDKEIAYNLGLFSRLVINYIVQQLQHAQSYVIDSNFSPGPQTEIFIKLVRDLNVIEIFLKANGDVLFERFSKRVISRHPTHLEHYLGLEKFKDTITNGSLKPLGVGELIEVDTTNFNILDFDKICGKVRNLVTSPKLGK